MKSSMPSETIITLPVPPRLNTKYRTTRNGGFYTHKTHRDYKTQVQKLCIASRVIQHMGLVKMTLVWYRSRKAGDIDSRLKTLLDALNGFMYEDDSQIHELQVYRSDADKKNPRVVLKVEDLDQEKLPAWA